MEIIIVFRSGGAIYIKRFGCLCCMFGPILLYFYYYHYQFFDPGQLRTTLIKTRITMEFASASSFLIRYLLSLRTYKRCFCISYREILRICYDNQKKSSFNLLLSNWILQINLILLLELCTRSHFAATMIYQQSG